MIPEVKVKPILKRRELKQLDKLINQKKKSALKEQITDKNNK